MIFAAPAARAETRPPEVIALATLSELTLARRDWAADRRAFERQLARTRRSDNEDEAIVVSNHCGEARATFLIVRATSRLPRQIIADETIGEFCLPPYEFAETAWLLVLDARTREVRRSFPVFYTDGEVLFAITEFGLDPRRPLLATTALPEPLEYNVNVPPDELAAWVARRPSLEIRDGRVWLVSAIPVASIFPGITVDEVLHTSY